MQVRGRILPRRDLVLSFSPQPCYTFIALVEMFSNTRLQAISKDCGKKEDIFASRPPPPRLS